MPPKLRNFRRDLEFLENFKFRRHCCEKLNWRIYEYSLFANLN